MKVVKYGHMIAQNAGNSISVDLARKKKNFFIFKNIAKIRAKKGGFGTLESVLACKCFFFLRQKSDPRGVSGT